MTRESVYRFYSNGKLLITGEYLVLHGAISLALPTKAGQYLYVHRGPEDGMLHWKASVLGKHWFRCSIRPGTWDLGETDDKNIALKLMHILQAASDLKGTGGWLMHRLAVSEIGFDVDWGLGSSSSLISNIAWWAGVDPFRLFRKVSRGSGYDIAAARSDRPLLYRIGDPRHGVPEITRVDFFPSFADRLAFVYLGRKQNSASSVKNFLNHTLVRETDIRKISELSGRVVEAADLAEYEQLLTEHEQILSGLLDKPTVKDALFRDYPGMIKSLGAWGGDFMHISLPEGPEPARKYFKAKGLDVLIPYLEMVLPPSRDTQKEYGSL